MSNTYINIVLTYNCWVEEKKKRKDNLNIYKYILFGSHFFSWWIASLSSSVTNPRLYCHRGSFLTFPFWRVPTSSFFDLLCCCSPKVTCFFSVWSRGCHYVICQYCQLTVNNLSAENLQCLFLNHCLTLFSIDDCESNPFRLFYGK